MEKFYIKISSQGVEGAPVAGSNLKLLFPDIDLTHLLPSGWVEFERRFDSMSNLPHRYYKPVTKVGFEGSIYVEHHTFELVTDETEKSLMRSHFYQESHDASAVFSEEIGAWVRPEDVPSLNTAAAPNVD